MKTKLLLLIVAVLLFTGMTFSPTKWEYKTEDRCFDEKRINALGQDGWELAGFAETERGAWHCVFKRQL